MMTNEEANKKLTALLPMIDASAPYSKYNFDWHPNQFCPWYFEPYHEQKYAIMREWINEHI